MDLFVDTWLQFGHNCIISGYDNYGHFDDGTGFMKLKKNDLLLNPVQMNGTSSDLVEYTSPLFDEFLLLICAYN